MVDPMYMMGSSIIWRTNVLPAPAGLNDGRLPPALPERMPVTDFCCPRAMASLECDAGGGESTFFALRQRRAAPNKNSYS